MYPNHDAYKHAELIVKHLRGELSVAEEIDFNNWLAADVANQRLVDSLSNEAEFKTDLDFLSGIDTGSAWDNIIAKKEHPSLIAKIYRAIAHWQYAAVLLALLISGAAIYRLHNSRNQLPNLARVTNTKHVSKYKNDIAPGNTKATLTLSDGSVVVLDSAANKIVGKQAGVKIINKNGSLVYNNVAGANLPPQVLYNTISIPRGGQYHLILPDGSNVWLNASSSLTYPTVFSGTERKVKLSGEAYFEVEKNKEKPFKVIANNMEIAVLGTHFNVMAYDNEKDTKTTLLEGSVKVTRGAVSNMIIPGQTASLNNQSGSFNIVDADIDEVMAWKKGIFLFRSDKIEDIMRQISRWYDVEVDYKQEMPVEHFTGMINRNNNVSKILNMLELTGGVRFNIDGKKIIVSK